MHSQNKLRLWRNARLATLTGTTPWGALEQAALLTSGETIVWVGREDDLPANQLAVISETTDLENAWVTPGLIDCHTHLVYGGHRAHEFELRLQGASYDEIARTGGGIRSTVAATRAANNQQLLSGALQRAKTLMAEGVTTIEIKSGYGLSLDDEARCLEVARQLQQALPLSIRTTYLGAHAVPAEYAGRTDDYIDAVCGWMIKLHAQGLIDAVDAFCEKIGFTLDQTQRVFETARSLNIPVKLHAEQLSDQGGAALAAHYSALSCDHLEYLSPEGVRAMQAAGSVAVLLPAAYYFLRETQKPPVQLLRDHCVPIALATDHNPGTAPGLSLLLMLNMACTLFDLTPEEALRGVTQNAARALGLTDRGILAAGYRADFCVWNVDHPRELAYWIGVNRCARTIFAGQERN